MALDNIPLQEPVRPVRSRDAYAQAEMDRNVLHIAGVKGTSLQRCATTLLFESALGEEKIHDNSFDEGLQDDFQVQARLEAIK